MTGKARRARACVAVTAAIAFIFADAKNFSAKKESCFLHSSVARRTSSF